jgi:hypothetical protein
VHQDADSKLQENKKSEQIRDLLCHTEQSSAITSYG